MFRPIVAALTSVSIVFASPALADSRRSNDDVARALAGLAAIAIIGAAISDNNRSRTSTPPRPQPQPEPRWSGHEYRQTRFAPLPEHCRSEVRFGRERTDVYAEQCLNRSYADAWRLPQECRVTYDSRDGRWSGYDADCVERQGRRRH